MPNQVSKFGKTPTDAADSTRDRIPTVSLTASRDVPVCELHHRPEAEEYIPARGFKGFMIERRSGFLKRPVFQHWAGRFDFEGNVFSGQLCEAFSAQFDLVRSAYRSEASAESRRWPHLPSLNPLFLWVFSGAGGFAPALLLFLAATAGGRALRCVWSRLRSALAANGNPKQPLDELISGKKDLVGQAQKGIDVRLLRNLDVHPQRDRGPGLLTDLIRHAWLSPKLVRERMV